MLPVLSHEREEGGLAGLVRLRGRRLCSTSGSATRRDLTRLRRDESTEVTSGVAESQRTPVTEGGVPEERKVDTFKLGQAQVLSSPRLDVLHPEEDNTQLLVKIVRETYP